MIYHILNRAVSRSGLFDTPSDYNAFEKILGQTQIFRPMRLLAYCLMPNHWHLVLWPEADGDLPVFMQRLTTMHARRWHEHHHSVGSGHVYQGRYKSFIVEVEEHLLALFQYVERNPLRANLVERVEHWTWCSLWKREQGGERLPILTAWPIERPSDWIARLNQLGEEADIDKIRCCVNRSQPLGRGQWVDSMIKRFGLIHTIRSRGRPKKQT